MKTYDKRVIDVQLKMHAMQKEQKRRKKIIGSVSMVMAVVVLALVLFVPYSTDPPSVREHSDSPYYELIQKINLATFEKPRYKNHFQALSAAVRGFGKNAGAAPEDWVDGNIPLGGITNSAPNASPNAPNSESTYEEVTDNQVQGVIESDLIKRSNQYIYYLRGGILSVYSIAKEDSVQVGEHVITGFSSEDKELDLGNFSQMQSAEMYLSQDCTTVTVLIDAYNQTVGSCTILVNLDVTDPENITETGRVFVTGNYNSSRMVDGSLLLMNHFRIRANQLEFSDESTFLPQIGVPGDMHSVAAEDILAPDTLTNTQYTVVCKLNGKTLEVMDTAAFLSYSDELYVSQDAIFATRGFTEKETTGLDRYTSTTMTEITGVSYTGQTLEKMGSVILEGNVKNQYAMDQYDGILRVVTSTAISDMKENYYGDFVSVTGTTKRNVNLYCIDLQDWAVVASVVGFAPEGEAAESVRFDGDTAYVCTAEVITLTDPVYFFDLSDLNNITWKDTGTIDGYSTSLVNLGDGYLLGIGYGDRRQLKIEIYEEVENGVRPVCAYERNATFSEDYKAYLIDREQDLVGLQVEDWRNGGDYYLLLRFDGYELSVLLGVEFLGSVHSTRGVLIDGYLYLLGHHFQVEKVY